MNAEPLGTQLLHGEGSLVVGDVGLLTLRCLLENGVGYIVTGWNDRATPIDAAIADTRQGVLDRAGVRLRRLREAGSVETVVKSSGIGLAPDQPRPRGAVIWNGVAGMVPVLERFAQIDAPAPVVGLCFDTGIVRSRTALVLDPPQTLEGLADSIDRAFTLSAAAGRPVLVLIRQRLLGARAVRRTRPLLTAAEAAPIDASVRAGASLPNVCESLGLTSLEGDAGAAAESPTQCRQVIVCPLAFGEAVRQARDVIAGSLAVRGRELPPVVVLTVGVPAAGLSADLLEKIEDAESVLVLEAEDTSLARCLADAHATPTAAVTHRRCAVEHVRGPDIVEHVVAWLLAQMDPLDAESHEIAATLQELVQAVRGTPGHVPEDRIPRRGAGLRADTSAVLQSALTIVQGELGVPARIDPAFRTYRLESGAILTVASSSQFGVHGPACAAPGAAAGVFVIDGPLSAEVQTAASAMGVAIEVVPGGDPTALAASIARACATAPLAPRVIVAAPVANVVDPGAQPGFDERLLSADSVSLAALDPAALDLHDAHGDLDVAPLPALREPERAAAALPVASTMSPAWYQLRAGRPARGVSARVWSARRRILRAMGVDA